MSRKFLVLSALALGLMQKPTPEMKRSRPPLRTLRMSKPLKKTSLRLLLKLMQAMVTHTPLLTLVPMSPVFLDWTTSKKHPQLRTLPKIWQTAWTTTDTPKQTLLTKT